MVFIRVFCTLCVNQMGDIKMKTVNDLFILECMKNATVLAGHNGLNRPLQFAKVSDTPDIVSYLKEHYLLLTTAYAFKDDTEKLLSLLREMDRLNCSGILIKIDRFLKKLPPSVKQLADQINLPIINLHPSQTLGDVSRHILNYLNDHELEQLYYALHVHEKFSDMMYKGYNLSHLIEKLGLFLKRPTLLLNHRAEIMAQSHDFRKDSFKLIKQEVITYVKENINSAREGLTFFTSTNKDQAITTYPVKTIREQNSMLVVIDSLTIPYPSSQIAIEQAGSVISFTITKEQAINENARLLRNNFFADLIDRRIQSDRELISRANFYGLDEELNSICVACKIDSKGNDYDSLLLYEHKVGELHNSVYDQLEDEIANANINALLFTKEKYFILIIQCREYTKHEMNKVKTFVEKTRQNIIADCSISFGISNPTKSLSSLSTAYQEAIEAILSGEELGLKGFINFYKAKEVEELLSILPKKDLKAMYENTLVSLAYPETDEEFELQETIKTYLDFQCNISETARKLFIHRNTVKYRIEKAESMLGRSFADPEDTLRVRVALVIGSILEDNKLNTSSSLISMKE